MAASSVTGKGLGNSNKPTSNELAKASNGPVILAAGIINAEASMSPPSSNNRVTFPHPLSGAALDHATVLTTLSGGSAYIAQQYESDGNYTGFTVVSESECTVFYIVCKTGHKPT